ncbi:MAG: septal ring lytic transglycosylase RlpA family lipoprotein [Wolbachia endosymbiont of Andrena agilissima]|nr:septal ring lytic transglycosylase RlpA family lipoprotein [Wolbachia endosymbiont of Andrena agilissima]
MISSCSFSNRFNCTAGHYKIGSSYTINGITYHPKNCKHYEEIGIASWYGIEDHGTLTANGEAFNRHLISAAHKTLPLPCFVLVTNLENGRKLVTRVNDRGLAKVKVQYLRKMSEQLIQNTPHYRKQYEKEMQKRHPKQDSAESKGYVAFFKSAQAAKSAASKLRNQGIKNVRLLFKNDQYCVKVSYR